MATRTGQSGRDTTLARRYLARHGAPFPAYMSLQREMLRRIAERRGISVEDACEQWSPVFAARFRWMLDTHDEDASAGAPAISTHCLLDVSRHR